jgi:pyrroloquinoline quinone biosynthesis protein B
MGLLNLVLVLLTSAAHAASEPPYLYILGVVQDAGYPQIGCYAVHCQPGWEQPQLRRGATALGLIDPDVNKTYLFEATPNIGEQLYQLDQVAPASRYVQGGIFLTHAHIGHYAGLMFLGQEAQGARHVPVYAMPRMLSYLNSNGPWSQLVTQQNILLQPLVADQAVALSRITVTPFLVPHRDEYSETVGYRITGPAKSALFIPDINKWSDWSNDIKALVETVDYALVDATFYADGELPGRDMTKIPHPFVTETMTLFDDLALKQRQKIWFIHFNHTNPLLDPQSAASQAVRDKGFNIAQEGIRLPL